MVWPFGSSSVQDASDNLDSDLKRFLDKEAPHSKSQAKTGSKSRAQDAPGAVQDPRERSKLDTESSKPNVPPQSLYQDGRYAHLWKTYQPRSAVELVTEKEQLRAIKDSVEIRGNEIKKAVQENCAFEAMAEYDCWTKGSLGDKMWMCRDQTNALERCEMMQTRFLRALGYMSIPGRSADEEERIQMHADGLYQQMLKHEEAIRKAKEAGQPPPEFKPVMSRENLAKVLGVRIKEIDDSLEKASAQPDQSQMSESDRKGIAERLEKMSPEERALDRVEVADKRREAERMLEMYTKFVETKKEEQREREIEGRLTLGDRLQKWWWNEK